MEHKIFDNSGNSVKEGALKTYSKFLKTFSGFFTVPFSFRPEISEFLVEWKAPLVCYVDFQLVARFD